MAAAALDPALAITTTTMADRLDSRLGQERLLAWSLSALSVLGFVIAAVGLHGLASQAVAGRLREFGIRLAVGASRGHVMGLVLRSAFRMALIGIPVGIGLAWLGGEIVRSRLFGVGPGDPVLHLTAALTLVAVVLLSTLRAAWRASRANPVDVLRAD
jgi:ABC-type antimicrobial peptide transport system permease subunit